MIKVTMFIDNKTAHSCSPLKFVERFILQGAREIGDLQGFENIDGYAEYNTPYAKIKITEIEQD